MVEACARYLFCDRMGGAREVGGMDYKSEVAKVWI